MFHIRTVLALATIALSASSHAQGTAAAQTEPAYLPTAVSAQVEPYFIVTRIDGRKCAYPMCGGYFVKAVNKATTRCADGRLAKECHAVELDTRALGWNDAQRATFERAFSEGKALVKGALTQQPLGHSTGNVLRVSEAWQGQSGHKRPLGTFYSLKNNGIVCIQAPCPAFSLSQLNRPARERTIDMPDFSLSGATEEAIQAAWVALEQAPILAVGVVVPFPAGGLQGTVYGQKLLTSEFYLPAKP
ncbi:hypothetical protein GTZ97_14205 [Aquabacterium fontiphilum]|uniref:DUF6748 domain-containing protein n=1 Tax=Aquabacterium fontiphilum TaxID=450365 RepID=UPI00137723BD|nr:DUF6748 domain-containing protein [Aquabacterium fontiphilum]NBD21813.1 hypothetical protein [Aquabacterium fontiphilum]